MLEDFIRWSFSCAPPAYFWHGVKSFYPFYMCLYSLHHKGGTHALLSFERSNALSYTCSYVGTSHDRQLCRPCVCPRKTQSVSRALGPRVPISDPRGSPQVTVVSLSERRRLPGPLVAWSPGHIASTRTSDSTLRDAPGSLSSQQRSPPCVVPLRGRFGRVNAPFEATAVSRTELIDGAPTSTARCCRVRSLPTPNRPSASPSPREPPSSMPTP